MKKKTVWSLLLALAMTVTAIGASTAAFAAAPNQAEPQTLIATENEDAIWEQIEAVEEKSDALLAQLREGRIDAALLALPIHDEQLHVEPLFDEPFLLATREGGAFAKERAIGLDDLDEQTLLLLEDGHCLRRQTLDVCHLAGAHEKSEFRATSLETLRQMVAAGAGITLMPKLATLPPIAQPRPATPAATSPATGATR